MGYFIKYGVKFVDLVPQMVLANTIISQVIGGHGYDVVITSGSDGQHKAESLHYSGRALDYRTRNMDPADARVIATELSRALGENYDVVLEDDHIHVEYDPK